MARDTVSDQDRTGEPGDHHARRFVERHILESAATNARDAIVVTLAEPVDAPGPRIVYVNAAFETMTGYSWSDAVGETPRMLQGPKTDPTTVVKIRAALAAWSPIDVELLSYRKNGSSYWAELSIFPVADDTGVFTHWVSIERDVSRRKAAEAGARSAEEKARALKLEIARRVRSEAQLAFAAFHDELTGLRNRPYLLQRIQTALDEARAAVDASAATAPSFALLFIDLDRFKVVNDSLGHTLGDDLLRQVAVRLGQAIRSKDTLARIGGDEFVILLDDGGLAEAVSVARRIVASLEAPIAFGNHGFVVTPSIGIADWRPDHQTVDSLMRDADTAMYSAKRAGGNRYEIFTEPMHVAAVAALELHNDLRGAIERDEFVLHYQPIFDVAEDRMTGIEALVRWNHPTRGRLAPSTFIPLAEEIGLIAPFGAWVLQRACSAAKAFQDRFDADLSIWVNVSSRELLDASFVSNVDRALSASGLPPTSLVIEITESAFLAGPAIADTIVVALRALGVRIALDDFGTGYSSLGYLGRFTIDILKIDRSFIAGVSEPSTKRHIVQTIASLAASLAMQTVAEGVETPAQCDALLELGCTHMQGFLFSRRNATSPLDEAEATALLAGRTDGHVDVPLRRRRLGELPSVRK